MKKLLALLALAGALTLAAGAASAQDDSADQLIQSGLQVLHLIDADRDGDLWDAAAPFVKARFPKAELMASFRKARESVGTVAQRTWASVNRIRYLQATNEAPAGLYANIDYSTRLTDGRTVFELVTFMQGANGTWHLVGYAPRQRQ